MSTKKAKEKIKKPITNDEEILEDNEKKSLIILGLGIILVIVLIIGVIIYLNFNKVEKDSNKPNDKESDKQQEVEQKEDTVDTVVEEEDYYINPVVIVNKPTVTKYTVEYYNGDVLLTTKEIESGKNTNGYDLTLEGRQKLKYWYYLVDGSEVVFNFDSDTVTSNLKLYAKIVNLYSLEIKDPEAEEGNIYELIAEENNTLTSLLENLSEEEQLKLFLREKLEGGYEALTGFFTDKGLGEEFKFDEDAKINKDYILYAKYESIYGVTYYYEELEDYEDYVCRLEDDGELSANCSIELVVENQKATKITDLTLGDKTVKEWYLYNPIDNVVSDKPYDFDKTTITNNIILVPVYGYVLTFDSNDGSEVDPVVLLAGETIKSELNAIPTKEGYKFERWEDETGEEIDFGLDTMPEHDLTVYAKWNAAITFNSKGGSEIEAQIPVDGKILMPETEPTREGYIFDGWYYDEEYTLEVNFGDDTFTAPDVLYAKWQEVSYKVTYDPNGGTRFDGLDTVEEVTVTPGESIEIADLYDVYENEGRSIIGWSYTSDGSVDLAKGEEYTPTGNITLYAVWAAM